MDLFENGKDSLKKSIKIFNELNNRYLYEKEYKLKDVVINLHHSIETIFKYMIKEKNEYLIFDNCEEIFKCRAKSKFNNEKSVELKTIQFLDAVHRVIALYDIGISKQDYNKFILLNKMRNALTHYEKEFTDNEVEHLISLLIPILLSIYKDNISDFDKWARFNSIYSNVKNSISKNDLWLVKKHYNLREKWKLSQTRWDALKNNGDSINKIYTNRNKSIEYIKCPICMQNLFHVTGAYIVNSDEVLYLGKCECCEVDIIKEDAEFIALNYGKYENYNLDEIDYIKDKIITLLLSYDLNSDFLVADIREEVIETIALSKELFYEDFKRELGYKIDAVCNIIAEIYFDRNVYQFNEVMEQIIENEDSKIYHDIIHFIDEIRNNETCMKYMNTVEQIINIFDTFDSNLSKEIINSLNTSYISFHNGMYLDFDGNDVESEITFEMDFDYDCMCEALLSKCN